MEFEGSNDGGQTWRTYPFRYIPQREDRISAFIAPWYARFEATVQIAGWNGKISPLMPAVAAHLLTRNPDVMRLFESDPFPDRAPTLMRMRGYRMRFTDPATQKRTGLYWHKEPAGNYQPMLYMDETGQVAQSTMAPWEDAMRHVDYATAFAYCEQQYQLGDLSAGVTLAGMYARGEGVPSDPSRAFTLYAALASAGELSAELNLGRCYESGSGVSINYAQAEKWYRTAARHGSSFAVFSLGVMHADNHILPRNDIEGLALLLESQARAIGEDMMGTYVREHAPAKVKRLMDRMSAADIARAKQRAADRSKTPIPTEEPE